jgi:signal transduction histidine kinase
MAMNQVLIVEDSRMFAEILRINVENKLPFTARIASSYGEAVKIIESHAQDFFVALLDMNLPDAPNGEIIDYVISRNIPSIVFTSKFDDSIRDEIFSKKVVDYVLKDNVQSVTYIINLVERLYKNQHIKVLIVDDSATTRSIIIKLLRGYRFQVLDAPNGQVALELLSEHSDVKLVITDYAMPVMDGFVLTEKIRQKYTKNELALIGISGSKGTALSARFLKLGANDFLAKPFSNEEFYCRVIQNIETIEYIQKLKELNELKNKFLGIAAHDLRNPINAIYGFSELILDGLAGPLNEEQKEYLGIINKASEDMLNLVNDLLDVSVIESGKLEIKRRRASLYQLVRDQLKVHKLHAEQKNITIVPNLEQVPDALFDPERMTQVINNLLSNAIKFSPSGEVVIVSLTQEDSAIVFKVKDNGPGISPEDQEKLFGEFQRLSAKPTAGEKSTGLGLAIVKKIVEAHGGQIGVSSSPGQGAEFYVRLPIN